MKLIYKEYDIPRTKEIERLMAMTQEERDALLAKAMEEVREERKRRQEEESRTDTDSFFTTSNMEHLAQVTAAIDSGMAKLTEHEMIEE